MKNCKKSNLGVPHVCGGDPPREMAKLLKEHGVPHVCGGDPL